MIVFRFLGCVMVKVSSRLAPQFIEPCTSLNTVWQELCLFWSSSLNHATETGPRHRKVFVLFCFKINRCYLEFCEELALCFLVSTNELTEPRKKLNERAGRINKDIWSLSLFVSCLECLSPSDVCCWIVVKLFVVFIRAEVALIVGVSDSFWIVG